MNTSSFERQMQQIEAPVADPAARQRARQLAVAEFERIQREAAPPAPVAQRRAWPVQMLAAASVAALGVILVWRLPEEQRIVVPGSEVRMVEVAPVRDAPATVGMAPVTHTPATAEAAPITDVPATAEAAPMTDVPATAEAQTPTVHAPVQREATSGAPGAGTRPADAEAVATVAPASRDSGSVASDNVARRIADATSVAPTALVEGNEEAAVAATELQEVAVKSARIVATVEQLRNAGLGQVTIAGTQGLQPQPGGRTLTLIDGRSAGGVPPAMVNINDALAQLGPGVPVTSFQRTERAVYMPPSFRFPPPAPARDQFTQFESNPVKSTAAEPVSTFSLDVDTSAYSFVRRQILDGRLPSPDAVRVEEMINYFDYAWPAARSRNEPFGATVAVSDSPWAPGRKLVHIGIRGYELAARRQPDVNLVLLLDVSGSMNEPDKLPLARRSMRLLLDSLKPTDTISIATYAGSAGEVLGPTPVRDRQKIEAALDALSPGGSTAGAQGIRLAYQLAQRSFRDGGMNRILLATDGDFNVGVSDLGELQRLVEQERARGVYLSVLGFGQGNYRDDIAQVLAQHGNGVAAYIDSLTEARKVLVREATSALFPIAQDVKIQVEFNPATVAEYRLIGYETRALQREDFSNDQVDAAEVGSGRSVTAIYEITPVGSGVQLIDELRYAQPAAAARTDAPRGRAGELGFLKIRYKLPGEGNSQLIERPIRMNAGVPRSLRRDVEFSTAVAGFGQLLRNSGYVGSFGYDDVLRLARPATGEDPHGDRTEFISLVEDARELSRDRPDVQP